MAILNTAMVKTASAGGAVAKLKQF